MNPTPLKNKYTPWRVQISGRYFPDGKRKAKLFKTRKEADDFCIRFRREGPSILSEQPQIPKKETDRYGALVQLALSELGNDPDHLFQAISHYKKTRLNVIAATVREGVEEFQRIREHKVSASTWDSDRYRLLKLIKAFERRQCSEITPADLRRFFDELGRSMNTRSVYKSVRTFFVWAKDYNYVAVNPMLEIKAEDEFGVNNDIYKPYEFERMLRIAAGLEAPRPGQEPTKDLIDLLPWFALSGFCGLRSCEAYRLNREADAIQWSDLYFERGFIHIRNGVAKATRRASDERHIERPHAIKALQAWLELVPHKSDFICSWTKRHVQELKRRFRKATGIKFVENGLRNSFASYALTYTGLEGVGKLSLEMGDSEGICKRHYIRTLEPGSGRAWFGIWPATPPNVIPISENDLALKGRLAQ